LNYHFTDHDSLNADFWLRNRIGKSFNINLIEPNKIEIQFMDENNSEILKSFYFDCAFQNISLEPKSQKLLYRFSISRQDTILSELRGSLYLKIILHGLERDIFSSCSILLN